MPKRVKDEERIEMIIRGLLKLQENRRCINCNSLGPQYVCTTFWTFVCTKCSGVHREFMHRVKSVSMAKFNAEELNALQAGGNERARQIYFKAWDPQNHSCPDGSNLHRLRDFIKHVYVDRKYTSDRSVDKLAMVKVGANEDLYEQRSIERYSPGGRNDRSLINYIDERRSPQYKLENVRSGRHKSRPVHFEIVDDRFRDDNSRRRRKAESCGFSDAESRVGSRSPDSQKSREISPPVVRSIREILGDNVPPLKIGERPAANDERDGDGSSHFQKTSSPSTPGSVDGKVEENRGVNLDSLIDFSIDIESSDTTAVPQTLQTAPSIDGGNLALVLSSTSVSEAPSSGHDPSSAAVASSHSVSATSTASTTNVPSVPSNGGAPAVSSLITTPALPNISGDFMVKITNGQQLPTMQQYRTSGHSSSTAQQNTPSEALYKQPWNLSLAPNSEGPSGASAEQSSQAASTLAQDPSSGTGLQEIQVAEAIHSGRKELPVDLFGASYSSFPAPVPSWQMHPPHGMGFGMQYHPTVLPVPTVPNSAKTKNPFDLDDDTTQVQAPTFPSMASLQGALPMVSAPKGLLHSSSFGVHPPQFMQPQSSPFAFAVPSQSPSYGMAMPPRTFIGQQLPNSTPPFRPQGIGNFGSSEAAFAFLNTMQQPSGRYPAPATPNSFSPRGGNPFE
ncbi:probable ADP-ribosylation factor GTPase-activating protein AGD14 isoform X2 [Cornus florida]|uniref:probable ADP-ribosylation factor GTPase-activating protein AGD14 isoform X2 n=1 Tax=Cornus florida TaxID=4283 RepID=UPI00289F7EF9|nr:probable ADP-ribosylation factor GTPase-activating protein AGD14 isoform X2 [Cornus florida]